MVLTWGHHNGALRFYVDGIEALEADRHAIANLLNEIGKTIGKQDSEVSEKMGQGHE